MWTFQFNHPDTPISKLLAWLTMFEKSKNITLQGPWIQEMIDRLQTPSILTGKFAIINLNSEWKIRVDYRYPLHRISASELPEILDTFPDQTGVVLYIPTEEKIDIDDWCEKIKIYSDFNPVMKLHILELGDFHPSVSED